MCERLNSNSLLGVTFRFSTAYILTEGDAREQIATPDVGRMTGFQGSMSHQRPQRAQRMGLDATIKRADGEPLGPVAEVQRALTAAFPGIVLGRLPSGAEKIRAAAERGVVFPDIIRQHLESSPAQYGGEYEGPGFSAQFNLGAAELVQEVDVVLYGITVASEPMFELLEREYGWVTTHP